MSVALHLLLALLLLFLIHRSAQETRPLPPVTVVIVPRDEVRGLPPLRGASGDGGRPSRGATPSGGQGGRGGHGHGIALLHPGALFDDRWSPPSLRGIGAPHSGPTLGQVLDEHFRREAIASAGGPHGVDRRHGEFSQPTDSIDGIPDLGSGQPGDPRIPGSGGVDIAAVIARDGVTLQSKDRIERGQIHPFLAAAKDRIENCWLPTAADVNAAMYGVPGWKVPDRGCSKGAHWRYQVARVQVVYDPSGKQLSFRLVGGTVGRNLAERVESAVDQAGMPQVPAELLDEKGVLRVAWNVYLDDYRGCGLIGQGASHGKPGGDKIIGIVELDTVD